MTVKQFIKKYGWNIECDIPGAFRYQTVDVSFVNSETNQSDETTFDIQGYDGNELSRLFKDFCKENGISHDTVTNITVVATALTVAELP